MTHRKFGWRSGVAYVKKIVIGDSEVPQLRVNIESGAGAPSHSATKGTLYVRVDGSSTSTRLYVNTDGSTTWTNFTSAA